MITHPLPAPGEDDKPAEDVSGGLPHIEALRWALVDPTREGLDVGYLVDVVMLDTLTIVVIL